MVASKTKFFSKGEIVFREGEPADHMYILVSGEIELSKPGENGVVMLKKVSSPNEFFGEMALIDGKPRSATATATKDTALMVVDGNTFEQLLRTNGPFAVKIISTLSARIRGANIQIVDLVDTDPKDRVVRAVADFAFQFGKPASGDARYVRYGEMRSWINSHTGLAVSVIDGVITRLVDRKEMAASRAEEGETESDVPTRRPTERLVIAGTFMRRFNRRHPSEGG